jgi:hypothetical protein
VQTWIAFCWGNWTDQWILIIFPFYFVAYLIIHYYFLKEFTKPLMAMLGTALLVSSGFLVAFAAVSGNDFILLYHNCSAIMLFLLWKKTLKDAFLMTGAFFSSFMALTKLEGSAYLLIHSLIVLYLLKDRPGYSWEKKIALLAKFLIVAGAIPFVFFLYKVVNHFPGDVKSELILSGEVLNRIPAILNSFPKNFFLCGNWNILWFLFLLSFANLLVKKWRDEWTVLVGAIVLFISFHLFLALLTSAYTYLSGPQGASVIPRLILHFFPLAVLSIILMNFQTQIEP